MHSPFFSSAFVHFPFLPPCSSSTPFAISCLFFVSPSVLVVSSPPPSRSDSRGIMYKELKRSFESLLASLSVPRPSPPSSSRFSFSHVKSFPDNNSNNLMTPSPLNNNLHEGEDASHSSPLSNDFRRERKGTLPNSSGGGQRHVSLNCIGVFDWNNVGCRGRVAGVRWVASCC